MIDMEEIKHHALITAIRDQICGRCHVIIDEATIMSDKMRFKPNTTIRLNVQSIQEHIAEIEELNAELKRLEGEE